MVVGGVVGGCGHDSACAYITLLPWTVFVLHVRTSTGPITHALVMLRIPLSADAEVPVLKTNQSTSQRLIITIKCNAKPLTRKTVIGQAIEEIQALCMI